MKTQGTHLRPRVWLEERLLKVKDKEPGQRNGKLAIQEKVSVGQALCDLEDNVYRMIERIQDTTPVLCWFLQKWMSGTKAFYHEQSGGTLQLLMLWIYNFLQTSYTVRLIDGEKKCMQLLCNYWCSNARYVGYIHHDKFHQPIDVVGIPALDVLVFSRSAGTWRMEEEEEEWQRHFASWQLLRIGNHDAVFFL